ncbi:PPOX class F420-dependent oxidoreductase [Salinibacterium sp. NSLL150]|uniref:PPOX class F420-dependent oxidoreductase n=1 Tax=unclassified Salinibacterium TaxID=2632331 RepID=UPI0018CCC558|nr:MULTISPECIES: PPOX class F420-dependent oxidoreductase [unclassified Salinibacterium]MBH0099570.1 PPOX class F420-dependent oxidoreductase [Salinibacterium sp. NSLL35]MBH0102324.1 PPOX class F420-dependent oxidoreductase [Salinibacterium sp. NSLL150]MBH0105084.1 PPOX class F420-dependent oxidoreductase [Salinibacterium sp. NSLL16]MBH0107844.1 PPOX class F420-dependent oxidoreductase [Salinibacterium sp. NSLL17]MBH0110606.1 PPOX class F420-dependent oxidoreductase [Salinibacterium sp. NG22]
MTAADFSTLATETYVSVTTFRKSGEPVSTPVWVVADRDRLFVTTAPSSGKVKRVRHTPRVEVTPCDMRGNIVEGAVAVPATAAVRDDTATLDVMDAALKKKYGAKYTAIRLAQKVRGTAGQSVALEIRL